MQLGRVCAPEGILAENPGFGLLEIDVAALLARGLRATYSPTLGKGHVSVWGLKAARKAHLRELQEQICERGSRSHSSSSTGAQERRGSLALAIYTEGLRRVVELARNPSKLSASAPLRWRPWPCASRAM